MFGPDRQLYGAAEGEGDGGGGRSEGDLGDDAVEVLALQLGELELERARAARAVGACEGAGAPGRACVREGM